MNVQFVHKLYKQNTDKKRNKEQVFRKNKYT